jgi:ubiquinone biosynthesis protein UbiJ
VKLPRLTTEDVDALRRHNEHLTQRLERSQWREQFHRAEHGARLRDLAAARKGIARLNRKVKRLQEEIETLKQELIRGGE